MKISSRHLVSLFLACCLLGPVSAVAAQIWSETLDSKPDWSSVDVGGGLLLAKNGTLYRHNPETGSVTWNRDDLVIEQKTDIKGLSGAELMLARSYPPQDNSGKKKRKKRRDPKTARWSALDLKTGDVVWQVSGVAGEVIDITAVPDTQIVLVFEYYSPKQKEQRGIYLSALNAADGVPLWRTRIASSKAKLGAKKSSRGLRGLAGYPVPVLHNNMLYLSHLGIHVIDATSGELKWEHSFRRSGPSHMHSVAKPLIDEDRVYVADKGLVYAYDLDSGTQAWKSKVRGAGTISELHRTSTMLLARLGGVFSSGKELDGLKAFGVVALDPTSGGQHWKYDDAEAGITNLLIEENKDRVTFADAQAVVGIRLSSGEVLYEAPLQFYRQYGIFDPKKSGFAISGGFSKWNSATGGKGGGGGLGGGGCSLEIGDLPLEISPKGEEYVIRGIQHMMTFDPRVMLVQWSVIVSDANPVDRTIVETGHLPPISALNRSYFLTTLRLGSGRRTRETLSLLGLRRKDGKVMARQDIQAKKPTVLIDHQRDRLFVMHSGKKKTVNIQAYSL